MEAPEPSTQEDDPFELLFQKGWTDGLPVIPPTPERVERMLKGSGRGPEELVARVPPKWGRATLAKIATNAVMAGCRPEYMPVILAGVEAMCDERFNLHGIQATTHTATPLFIVNGPIRNEVNINCGANLFGQGWRANATIGRALKLIITNVGGGLPGEIDKSCLGNPGKYTYFIGEYEEISPWEPLHTEMGFSKEESTITVFGADAPRCINDHSSSTARGVLTTIADALAFIGNLSILAMGETIVIISPEHARTIAGDGWSKEDAREFLFEKARRRLKDVTQGRAFPPGKGNPYWPEWVDQTNPDAMVPVAREPADIKIIVAGGTAGRFSAIVHGWGDHGTRIVTKKIEH